MINPKFVNYENGTPSSYSQIVSDNNGIKYTIRYLLHDEEHEDSGYKIQFHTPICTIRTLHKYITLEISDDEFDEFRSQCSSEEEILDIIQQYFEDIWNSIKSKIYVVKYNA